MNRSAQRTATGSPLKLDVVFASLLLNAGILLALVTWITANRLDLFYWIFGGILYIAGATIYMLRLPERFFPGLFDIFGSSHQIFHIFIVIAAVMTYYAALQSFYNR